MKFTDAGIALIKEFEGCSLIAYPDPATGGSPWTIGWGSTSGVFPGMQITREIAEHLLTVSTSDLSAMVQSAVSADLTDNEFTAAVCFAYNVKRWEKTPLFAFLKSGEIQRAADHWLLYCKADGKEMAGLKRRRDAELELFLTK